MVLNLEKYGKLLLKNSVDGYLSYIGNHLGVHFDDAQEGLMNLNAQRLLVWESLRNRSTSELKGFINILIAISATS